jgi:HSP20 family protein
MTIYHPWGNLGHLQREMSRLFEPGLPSGNDEFSSSDWTPAVDVKEEEDQFLIQADLPGVDPKDIELHIEKGVLSISGERESEARQEQAGYKRVERTHGSFYRRFSLPDHVDTDNIKAASHHGVLEITIPKKAVEQPRKITINH